MSQETRRKAAHAAWVKWHQRALQRAQQLAHAAKHAKFWRKKWHSLHPQPVTMFDSIDLAQIPADAPAVAGYTSGNWPTWGQLMARWPHAHRLSIAVNASHDADCLDVEPGDARPDQAADWVKRQRRRGIKRPVVYCSVSQAQTLLDLFTEAGLKRSQFRLWTAHYTNREHRCGPGCGFGLRDEADATQWTNRAQGRNLDQSICAPGFFS